MVLVACSASPGRAGQYRSAHVSTAPAVASAARVAKSSTAPTINPAWAKNDYIGMLQPHFAELNSDFASLSQCNQVDLRSCRQYLSATDQHVVDLQHDLNKYPAPACENDGDQELRSFAGIEHGALSLALRAIDENRPQLLPGANQEMKDAAPHLGRAYELINSARC